MVVGLATAVLAINSHDVLRAGAGQEATLDELVATGALLIAWVADCWLMLALALVAGSAAPGIVGRVAGMAALLLVPRSWQPVARALLGLGLSGSAVLAGLPAGAAESAPIPSIGRPAVGSWSMPSTTIPAESPAPAHSPRQILAPPNDQGAAAVSPLPSTSSATQPSREAEPAKPPATASPGRGGYPPLREQPAEVGSEGDPPAASRAAGRARPPVAPSTRIEEAHGGGDSLIVRPGDSLWKIAARQLGPRASAAAIAAEWPRWYATNRSVIGADPDLLLPGVRLSRPAD